MDEKQHDIKYVNFLVGSNGIEYLLKTEFFKVVTSGIGDQNELSWNNTLERFGIEMTIDDFQFRIRLVRVTVDDLAPDVAEKDSYDKDELKLEENGTVEVQDAVNGLRNYGQRMQ